MASFSYGLNRGTVDKGPEDITVGTLARRAATTHGSDT